MIELVAFTNEQNKTVYVNPAYVMSVEPNRVSGTRAALTVIRLGGPECDQKVMERVDDVVAALSSHPAERKKATSTAGENPSWMPPGKDHG